MDAKRSALYNCHRELILGTQFPILLKESLDWNILDWRLDEWSTVFENRVLEFRCGTKKCRKQPLWEGQSEMKSCTFQDFVHFCNDTDAIKNEWRYFDYKHIAEWFKSKIEKFQLSWKNLGFPERGAESSTLWIGSPGAYTPCHVDTYGSNIVVQVHGCKRWILFPFSELQNLNPTRVPYEESSIYSNVNFSCFHCLEDKSFKNCYMVNMSPGDILIIPPKWWHYVENLSMAISINTWIPHKEDDDWRLQEGLVKFFISSLMGNVSEGMEKIVLNPSEYDIENLPMQLKILEFCKNKIQREESKQDDISEDYNYLHEKEGHIHKYTTVPKITDGELKNAVRQTSSCLVIEMDALDERAQDLKKIIDAFCHPEVICNIANKFLNSYSCFL